MLRNSEHVEEECIASLDVKVSIQTDSQFAFLQNCNLPVSFYYEETKNQLNSGTACCHSVQNLFPSRLLPKRLKTVPLMTQLALHYMHSVRTSQETHYVSPIQTNRLMLFTEIIIKPKNQTTHMPSVSRMQSSSMLKQVVHMESADFKALICTQP
jgi:hypothetical protein